MPGSKRSGTARAGLTEPWGRRAPSAIFAGLLLIALVPIFSVDILPLVDYPNHLARMRILSEYSKSLSLQQIYQVDWALIPNMAMDLLVPTLAQAFGVILAGQIFVASTLLLLAAGTVLLHRTFFQRASLWPLAIFLFLYNYILSFGFLNYLFGVGGALILFALWIRSERWALWARLVFFPLGAFVLLICHVFGLGVYGIMLACYEVWRLLRRTPGESADRPDGGTLNRPSGSGMSDGHRQVSFAQLSAMIGLQFVPSFVVLVLSNPQALAEGIFAYDLATKITALQVPFVFFHTGSELVLSVVVLLGLFMLWRRFRIEVAPAAVFPLIGLVLAVIATPSWLLGNWGNDFRLMVPLVCLSIAGTDLRLPRSRFGSAIALLILTIFLLQIAMLTHHWRAYDRLFAELRVSGRSLEVGSRILTAVDDWREPGPFAPTADNRTFDHSPALLVLENDVYVPNLFTAPGRQPLSVTPAYAETDVPSATPMRLDRLIVGSHPDSSEELYRTRRYDDYSYKWADWPSRFDYLLMLEFKGSGNPLPALLTPHHKGSFFTIYRIRSQAEPRSR